MSLNLVLMRKKNDAPPPTKHKFQFFSRPPSASNPQATEFVIVTRLSIQAFIKSTPIYESKIKFIMPFHNFSAPRGQIVNFSIESTCLQSNLLGDPATRQVSVYLPEGYDQSDRPWPVFVYLASYTSSGLKQLAWSGFAENCAQRIDRLIASGKMGPIIAVFPDCFTSLGGNQYINSSAMGMWEDYLVQELIPQVDQRFRSIASPSGRAVLGKSSGGYGSLLQGLRHADAWAALACHSGDIDFERTYSRDFPRVLDHLKQYDGNIKSFLEHIERQTMLSGSDFQTLMILAMAASYAPDDASYKGIQLPIDEYTCEPHDRLWKRWKLADPLEIVDQTEAQSNLRRLRGLYIDCGNRDQYALHYGARAFCRKLRNYSIEHHYEEFDGTHSGIDHRLDVSLPFLFHKLS